MNPEIERLIAEIASRFREGAPDGSARLHVVAPSISEVTGFTATAVRDDGGTESFYIADDETEEDVLDKIEELRQRMAGVSGERGAWYTMTLDISVDGNYQAAFQYDDKPEFDFEVSRESFVADLEKFPRADEHVPDWLRRMLEEGRPWPTP